MMVMPDLISDEHLRAQAREHARADYGVYGHKWAPDVRALVERLGARTVLDYGCGKATLSPLVDAQNYDPVTHPCEPGPADLVVCTDVLCFVEPERLDAVLAHIRSLALRAVYIVVPRHPDHKTVPNRHELHWWSHTLAGYWPDNEQTIVGRHTRRLRFIGRAGT